MKLENKVSIITGGGRGIGRGIAKAYANEGANLLLVSRTLSQVEEVANDIRERGGKAVALKVDITNPGDVNRMLDETLSRYGKIDILINNAAVINPVGPFWSNDMKLWADTININVTGLALCCRAVLPSMVEQRSGKILNLSGAGVTAPSPTLSAYGTSKAAVIRFSETLASEVMKYSISVNCLSPGQIDTGMLDAITEVNDEMVDSKFLAQVKLTKSGRGASLDEASALAVWLGSSESDGLTGRMISATQDDWRNLSLRIPEIMNSDLHTLKFVS